MKQISKSAIVNLWGKTAQRPNQSKCSFINNETELVKFLNNPAKLVTNFQIVNEDVIILKHKKHEEYIEEDPFSTVCVAEMITSYA